MRSVSTRHAHCELPAGGAEPLRSPGRAGATLTEVLMAILIMAVGVVSVFTLFPITVLRTIAATNQTNAKILKQNVEEQLVQSPVLVFQFSASTANPAPPSPITTAGATMQGEWQPVRAPAYVVGDVVVPTIKAGGSIPRPLEFFQVSNVNPAGSTSGLVEPVWNTQAASITDGGLTWVPLNLTRYVVDPLGLNIARRDGQSNAVVDTFGNKTNKSTGAPTAFGSNELLRLHGGLTHPTDIQVALFKATDACVHPDSWQELFRATPTAVAADSVSFPATVDLTGFYPAQPALVNPRVVLTSLDGKQTVVRELDAAPAGQTLSWNNLEPLPNSFQRPPGSGNFEVGTARVEIFNRRYAWFLTVRNVGGRPEMKCVVTFNRSGAPAEEHAYAANFGNGAADLDGDGNADSTQGLTATNQAMIAWQPNAATAWDPEGTGANNNETDPLIKTGNWLFDARDVSWYRIQSIDASSATTAAPRWTIVTLDRTVRVTTPSGAGTPPPPNPPGRAILMPGIVEVFDL